MLRISLALVVLSVALLCSSPREAAAQKKPAEMEYKIKMQVVPKVGEQREVELTGTQVVVIESKKADKVVEKKENTVKVSFKGQIKTLAVNDKGRESKLELTVTQFTLAADGKEQTVLDKGTVVIGESQGDTSKYTRKDGGNLAPLADRLLPRFFNVKPREVGEEEVFGTDQPQKVGATWGVKKDVVVKELKDKMPGLTAEHITGSSKLVGVTRQGNTDYLDLEANLTLTLTVVPNPPPDMEGQSASVQFKGTMRVPADYTTGPVTEMDRMEMKGTFKGKAGSAKEGIISEFSSTETKERKIKYLGK